ncbi:hypothetical protein FPANT_8210 [Fusarium pseudoanthophilum]|uniref:Uncharacterized protein n=1 Tax=Fusarium pseudoanthophilum TaxID=48495 RepID=A0A8H5P055_9HYPO|nr:hypothetical protein FPANT_8210 [Fusarium pseudoanthophilum]
MTFITSPKEFAVVFDFYETDVVEKNQKEAGNNLFEPIRQKYGDRLLECEVDQWRFSIVLTECLDVDGKHLYQELVQVLKETGLFNQDGLFKEPQLFEWTVSEQTANGPKITAGHCSEALQLFRRYKGNILL